MTTNTAALLRHLADIVSRLRHMWDDTDGETHMPVEESDDISAIGSDIAKDLACADQWMDIAAAIRSHAASIDNADRVENETDGALVAAVTAAHNNDLSAASDAATCAFALLGLDSALRVRVERADSLAPGLPEGWEWHDGVHPYARQEYDGTVVQVERGRVWVGDGGDGIDVPASVVRAVLARAQGVGS